MHQATKIFQGLLIFSLQCNWASAQNAMPNPAAPDAAVHASDVVEPQWRPSPRRRSSDYVRADGAGVYCPVQVGPEVPQRAIKEGIVGLVKVKLTVTNEEVQKVEFLSGPPVYFPAVRQAISQYRCTTSGSGSATVTQEFDFRMSAKDYTLAPPDRLYENGMQYTTGTNAPVDLNESNAWMQAAADRGHGAAQMVIGARLAHGLGMPQDDELAHFWLLLSSAQNIPGADRMREEVAARLSPEQVEHGKRRAHDWKPIADKLGPSSAAIR